MSAAVEQNLYRASMAIPNRQKWATVAKQCFEFTEGKQWDDDEKEARTQKRRPALTINKIRPLVRLVYGYFVNQRTQIVSRPGNDFLSSDDIADVLTKVMSNVQNRQQWKHRKVDAFIEGLIGGRSYVDARLCFANHPFGEIKLTTRNPFEVCPDPEAGDYDPASWAYVLEDKWMSLDDILVLYGKASRTKAKLISDQYRGGGAEGFSEDAFFGELDIEPETYFGLLERFQRAEDTFAISYGHQQTSLDVVDSGRKTVRVIETQHRELDNVQEFVDLSTGQAKQIPAEWPREKVQAVLMWAESRAAEAGIPSPLRVQKAQRYRWRWTVTAGDQLLYDKPSPYRRPTIIPYFPWFRRGVTDGMVKDLLDPQTEINRRRSSMSEIISKMAVTGWMYEDNSLTPEGEALLQQFGSTPGVQIKYGTGKNPPQQIQANDAPRDYYHMEDRSTADLREISNINEAALGISDNADESGRAILARQRQAATSIGSYLDNWQRTETLLGLQMTEIIQDYYTQERLFRERGDDGKDAVYVINRAQADGTLLNDVTRGTYETAVDHQPLTANSDDLEFDLLKEMIQLGIPIPPNFVIDAAPIRRKREIVDAVQMQMAQQQAMAQAAAVQQPPAKGPPQ